MDGGHLLLYLDLLGFKRLISRESLASVCDKVEQVLLKECDAWTDRTTAEFDTIHFSDTVLIYARRPGSSRDWYDDLVYIGRRVCTALLARNIPVRGALACGSFLVRQAGRHKVFAGSALVEAHEREKCVPTLGFAVSPSVRERVYPAATAAAYLQESGEGIVQPDGSLLLSPFTQFRGHRRADLVSELEYRWEHRSVEELAWLDTEILGFGFVRDEALRLAADPNADPRVAQKYSKTDAFFRDVLGSLVYSFAESLVDPAREDRRTSQLPPSQHGTTGSSTEP